MFNYQSENVGKIINVHNVIQCEYDISKTLKRIIENFLEIVTNIFYNNVW